MGKQAVIVFSQNFMTRFMRDADMFEKGKVVLGKTIQAIVSDDYGQSHVDALLQICDKQDFSPIAIITDGFHWIDPNVQSVSDGVGWCLFEEYLRVLIPNFDALIEQNNAKMKQTKRKRAVKKRKG